MDPIAANASEANQEATVGAKLGYQVGTLYGLPLGSTTYNFDKRSGRRKRLPKRDP